MASTVETWNDLQKNTVKAVKANFPVDKGNRQLVLNGVEIDERSAKDKDIHSQEAAKERGRTWGANVKADVSLVDKKTGKVIDRSKVKLFTLPKPTERYSYIVNGTEYQVDKMWRLKSGVYSTIKANGALETEFNLGDDQGNPAPFAKESKLKVPFNPQTKQFKLKWATTNTSLYSVLKMLGVQDEEMKKAWGDDIYKANARGDKQQSDIRGFYKKVAQRGVVAKSDSYDDMASALVTEFGKTALTPASAKRTLDKPFSEVSGEALLRASKNILDVSKGDRSPDDRDSLVFKSLYGVDDFLLERLTRPMAKRTIRQKMSNNLGSKDTVREILAPDAFRKQVNDLFTSSTASKNHDQTNPLEMISNHSSTTILGGDVGGVQQEHALKKSKSRLINSSHMGFLDPVHTPESERTGINLNMPVGVYKDGNMPRVVVYDLKNKKVLSGKNGLTPEQLHSENIVLPDQVTWDGSKPRPISSKVKMKDPITQEIMEKPYTQGRYLFMTPHQLFDEATNLIPFLQNNQGNRAMTASKMATQAVGLKDREAPLVQVRGGLGNRTWENLIGTSFAHPSPIAGEVVKVRTDVTDNEFADSVVVKDSKGKKHEVPIYNHFPLNEKKSYLHSDVRVAVGDSIKKNQILADSNFTKDGNLALGTNLRVSYLPYKGYNFEDGIVISDSAAKKLTSEHVHRKDLEIDPNREWMNKKKFQAFASTTAKQISNEQMEKLDNDGVVQVGQTVQPGDILMAAVSKKESNTMATRLASRLDKRLFQYNDKSVKWGSDYQGKVVKVVKRANGRGAVVHVKTEEPAEIGDKIVGRHGNKSIITQILADQEMPREGSPDGSHVEVLMNPSGVPSRINLGQMLETAASKVAKKTGKPYVVNNFGGPDVDYTQRLKDELKEHGLSDTEVLYDPTTKRKLGDVMTGEQYIMKLKHQVEKKLSVRGGPGPNFSLDQAPPGGAGDSTGQAIGQLEFYSLLAHGARANLKDIAVYKADQHLDERNNPHAASDFWERVKMGRPLPAPKPTFVYRKFDAYLKGMGIDTVKTGNEIQLVPLTDKGVLSLSNGEIKDAGKILRGKDARELEKGLFDKEITGGLPNDVGKGLNWSHIALAEALPNPIFVGSAQNPGPAVVLSGLKFSEFDEVVKGKRDINGKTGGAAISELLSKVDVKKELTALEKELPTLRRSKLNHANKKAKYLRALKGLKMKPQEAYMTKLVPVLPPIFRPIVPMDDGSLRFDDVNHLYKSLGIVNNKLKTPIKDLPDSELQPLREELYDLLSATVGIGGTPQYESNRPLKGIMESIKGSNPKVGLFQSKLMKRRQELSMRSTIIPEPAMSLDEVGIPRTAAMELYKPFVIREIKRTGRNIYQASKEVKEETPLAWKALEKALADRPLLLKRDPSLHKFSIMAFKPKLVEGRAIQIHPLVTAGYNADFDGDTMSAFVPLTEEAKIEAHKMFPSNNLFSSTTGGIMYSPEQESLLGLHVMSKWGKDSKKKFSNMADAQKAYDKGNIAVNDVFTIGTEKTTLGRLLINDAIPGGKSSRNKSLLHDPKFVLVKHTGKGGRVGVKDILTTIAKADPKKFPTAVDRLKDLGNKHSYESGFSIGLKDLGPDKVVRNGIMEKADKKAEIVRSGTGNRFQKEKALIEVYQKATEDLEKALKPKIERSDNSLYTLVDSGARGKWSQFRQMNIAPMLMKDGTGKTLATPVRKSYAEGLDIGDYWTAMHGARMGTLQRSQGTSEPGRLTKEIVNVVLPELIVSKDCGSKEGVSMSINDDDIHDRYLAKSIKAGSQSISKGTLVTPHLTSKLKKFKVDKVVVRSPLKCTHGTGMCSKCFGLNEEGTLHTLGTNIGVIAGQSLGEPATQLAMDSFHTGGVAASRGGGAVDKFTRLNQLLNMPKKLPGSATLAKASGRVQKIEEDKDTKGWNVTIGGETHYAPSHLNLMYDGKSLKTGTSVKKGKPITDGHINPRELLPLTDIGTVQNYLTDELYDSIYKDERVRKRNIETIVRSLTNLTQIRNPGSSDFLGGDQALRTEVDKFNKGLKKGEAPITSIPLLKGTQQAALDKNEDWMSRLNFQRLKKTLLEGVSKGWRTDIHGTDPIPAYVYGAEFGEGTDKEPYKF